MRTNRLPLFFFDPCKNVPQMVHMHSLPDAKPVIPSFYATTNELTKPHETRNSHHYENLRSGRWDPRSYLPPRPLWPPRPLLLPPTSLSLYSLSFLAEDPLVLLLEAVRSGKPIEPSTIWSLELGLGWRLERGPLGAFGGGLGRSVEDW